MSTSSLVSYTRISPNRNSPRNKPIRKITLHHMAGTLSLEQFGATVAKTSRAMSANYAIDKNGKIGLFCPEEDRSWCSSSPANDHQAITVEIANDGDAKTNWHVSDAALEAAVQLCVDVCRRNGMPGLTWTGDANGTLTCHYMFTATACPGPYLKGKMAWIADEVNRRLAGETGQGGGLHAGDELKLKGTRLYVSSTATMAAGTRTGTYYLWSTEAVNGRARITNAPENVGRAGKVTGWISEADANAATGKGLSAGGKLELKRIKLYISSTAMTAAGTRTGTYYLWSEEAENGRVRITNAPENVGRAGKVTGWISEADAKAAAEKEPVARGTEQKIKLKGVPNVHAMAVLALCQSLKLIDMGLYHAEYADTAKTAQNIEIGPVSNGDAATIYALVKDHGQGDKYSAEYV